MPARWTTRKLRCAQNLGCMQAAQPAAALADRSTDGLDDDRCPHGCKVLSPEARSDPRKAFA